MRFDWAVEVSVPGRTEVVAFGSAATDALAVIAGLRARRAAAASRGVTADVVYLTVDPVNAPLPVAPAPVRQSDLASDGVG